MISKSALRSSVLFGLWLVYEKVMKAKHVAIRWSKPIERDML
jgi:hypothetical protein